MYLTCTAEMENDATVVVTKSGTSAAAYTLEREELKVKPKDAAERLEDAVVGPTALKSSGNTAGEVNV